MKVVSSVISGRIRLASLALPVLAMLVGCAGDDKSDLTAYIQQIKARKSTKIEPLPDVAVPEIYTYQSSNRVNPFLPFQSQEPEAVTEAQSEANAPDYNRVKEELEQYPLDSLRMVGTLVKGEDTWGLITAPDGAVHRIQVGNYMGKNHGKIRVVDEGRIELLEKIRNSSGAWSDRPAQLDLVE